MFHAAQLVHGDDIPVTGSSIADIDLDYFRKFSTPATKAELDQQNLSLGQVLTNMRLVNNGILTITGALLFARAP